MARERMANDDAHPELSQEVGEVAALEIDYHHTGSRYSPHLTEHLTRFLLVEVVQHPQTGSDVEGRVPKG